MGRGHFLCCLPARLGALIFSLGDFLASGILAAAIWYTLIHNEKTHQVQISKALMAGAIALGAISSIIALTSLAGFFGALLGRLGGIRAFARILAWLLGVQILFGILYIVAIFLEPKSEFVSQCEAGQTGNSDIDNVCTNKMMEVKGLTVGFVILSLLAHSYQLYVVHAYATQLEQKEMNKNIILGNSNSNSRYAPVGTNEEGKPLHGPDMSYPYADNSHSYGHNRGGSYA